MPSPNKVFTDPAVIELASACVDGKADRVAALLHQGADVRAVGKLGMTVPHFALLAQANASQVMKNTSLLFGAISGHNRPVVRLLLQRGADVNFDDGFSGSALHRAMNAYQFGIAADLVNAGIRLDITTNSRPTAKPTSKRKTALAQYCEDEGGKRGANPLPEIAAGWRELEAALARRGEKMPCGL